MKKTLIIVLVVILIVAAILCAIFIPKYKKEKATPIKETTQEVTIVGKWTTKLEGYDFTYTFNEDGTGNYNAAGTDMNFKYTLESPNKISILYDGDTETFDTTYEIKEDTLNVLDSFGDATLYTRVK